MPKDPIVEEIHQIRERLIEEHGGFDGYLAHLQRVQDEMRDRLVRRNPRPAAAAKKKVS